MFLIGNLNLFPAQAGIAYVRPDVTPTPPDGAPTDPAPDGFCYVVDNAGDYVMACTPFAWRYVIAREPS